MDEPTVTIPLDQYNQLRDNATMNHMLLDKIVGYETQMNALHQKLFEMDNKIFDLERKLKS